MSANGEHPARPHKVIPSVIGIVCSMMPYFGFSQACLAAHPPIKLELNGKQGRSIDLPLHPAPSARIDLQVVPSKVLKWPVLGAMSGTAKPTEQAIRDHFSAGLVALNNSQYLQAKVEFGKALSICEDGKRSYELGEQFIALELYNFAEQAFSQAKAQDTSLSGVIQEWKDMYFPIIQPDDETMEQFILALHTDKSQMDDLERLAALKSVTDTLPKYAPAWRWKAEWLTGRSYKMRVLRQAVGLSPGHFPELEAWGDGAMKLKLYNEAIGAYSQAKESIRNSRLAKEKGWLEIIEGKILQAEGSRLVERRPNRASAWNLIAEGLERQHRPLEAQMARKRAEQASSH